MLRRCFFFFFAVNCGFGWHLRFELIGVWPLECYLNREEERKRAVSKAGCTTWWQIGGGIVYILKGFVLGRHGMVQEALCWLYLKYLHQVSIQ
jgi:hypothetical protein